MGYTNCENIVDVSLADKIIRLLTEMKEKCEVEREMFQELMELFNSASRIVDSCKGNRNPSTHGIFSSIDASLLVLRENIKLMEGNVSLFENDIRFLDSLIDGTPENLMSQYRDYTARMFNKFEEQAKLRRQFYDVFPNITDPFLTVADEIIGLLSEMKEKCEVEREMFQEFMELFNYASRNVDSCKGNRNPSTHGIFSSIDSSLLVLRENIKLMEGNVSLFENDIRFLESLIDSKPDNLMSQYRDYTARMFDKFEEQAKLRGQFYDVFPNITGPLLTVLQP